MRKKINELHASILGELRRFSPLLKGSNRINNNCLVLGIDFNTLAEQSF